MSNSYDSSAFHTLDDDVFVRMPEDMWKANDIKATRIREKKDT